MKLSIIGTSCLHLFFFKIVVAETEDYNDTEHPCRPDLHRNSSEPVFHRVEGLKSILSTNQRLASSSCVDNEAAGYACESVDLSSFLSLEDMDALSGNDIWGWYDEVNDKEYAIVGLYEGTAFVDVSNPGNPEMVGFLPGHAKGKSNWRDIKTYDNKAYIVAESFNHGLQIFDMTKLHEQKCRLGSLVFDKSSVSIGWSGYTLQESAHLDSFGSAHNIFINEDSGVGYVVGASEYSGGLIMIDLDCVNNDDCECTPTEIGGYSNRGYTHDVQCINYDGPDSNFIGKEICFCSNEDHIAILDVTDKSSISLISTFYPDNAGYVHQGWLTEDSKYLLIDDETDESTTFINTRTIILDVQSLENPALKSYHYAETGGFDHNQYVKDGLVYQANYAEGLRILDTSNLDETGELTEVGYFDVDPLNVRGYSGSWSVYPFFPSGTVVVNSIERGLFVLTPKDAAATRNTTNKKPLRKKNTTSLFSKMSKKLMFLMKDLM